LTQLWRLSTRNSSLWVSIAFLTIILLSFHLQLHYSPLFGFPNTSAFGSDIFLFSLVYYCWFGLLMVLALRSQDNHCNNALLVCIFCLVFFGIWILNSPYGSSFDAFNRAGLNQFIIETGHIVFNNSNLNYLQLPAFFLLNANLAQMTGLGVLPTMELYLLFSAMLLGLVLYVFFTRMMSPNWATLSVLVVLMGSDIERVQAYASPNLSYIILLLILTLIVKESISERKVAISVLLLTFVTSYLPLPLYFGFFIIVALLMQAFSKHKMVHPWLVGLFFCVWISWLIFPYLPLLSGYITIFSPTTGLANPLGRLLNALSEGGSYVGPSVPLWTILTRVSWLVLFYGAGALAFFFTFPKNARKGTLPLFMLTGILSVTCFSLFLLLAFTPTGVYTSELLSGQWTRFLQLAPLFTVPLFSLFVKNKLRKPNRGRIFTFLVLMTFVLSLPSFFILIPNFSNSIIYPYQVSEVHFVSLTYPTSLIVFSSGNNNLLLSSRVYSLTFRSVPLLQSTQYNQSILLTAQAVAEFKQTTNSVFIMSQDFFPDGYPVPQVILTSLSGVNVIYSDAQMINFYH